MIGIVSPVCTEVCVKEFSCRYLNFHDSLTPRKLPRFIGIYWLSVFQVGGPNFRFLLLYICFGYNMFAYF